MLHAGPEKAPLADLADVLGRVGEEGGMTAGVAKLLFEKREDIERVFAEHDAMIASTLRDETELGDIMPIGDAR
ncbi:hypothetical protein SKP52_21790 [Sphingopyxis fribergensis]|uniref:Uncharacterized protein n=2 Tax=Sphingopyxis fribergensis TaxID=1515612 RepID=A0A0A7PMB7_9SPHN|nr:hypothetical protein SKP52_21790 [Sphingopyxis fribergensis]